MQLLYIKVNFLYFCLSKRLNNKINNHIKLIIMKNPVRIAILSIMLLTVFIGISGCKKKSDNPGVPSFTITYSTVNLQGGGEGVQLFAKCTNQAVDMEKVTITDPANFVQTYNFTAGSFAENELFPMQEDNVAYEKLTGTWSFNLVGNSTSGGDAFAVDETLTVSK
jgi:hypothetical protein